MAKRETPTQRRSDRPEPQPATEPRAAVERVAITLDADGKPVFDGMREATRDKLRRVFAAPETARALGLSTDDAPAVQLVPLDLARGALVAWSQLTTLGVAAITKAPAAVLVQHMPFNKEQLDEISPLVQKVISKHAGPGLTKWSDEITLGMILLTDFQMRLALIRAAMRETNATPPINVPPSPVTEIDHAASPAPAAEPESERAS